MTKLKRPLSMALSVLLVSGSFMSVPVTASADETGESETKPVYKITWVKDESYTYGTTDCTDGDVPEFPTWSWGSPEKNGTAIYKYEFKGWDPELAAAHSDATYTAVFEGSYVNDGVIDGGYFDDYEYNHVYWEVYESGLLRIFDTGESSIMSLPSNSQPWKQYNDMITSVRYDGRIGTIPEGAFKNMTHLESVEITLNAYGYFTEYSSITEIGASAFEGCTALKNVTLPTPSDGSLSISDYAFKGCESIETIALPTNLDYIGEGAFMNCKGLKYIALPDSVTTLSTSAFSGCSSLESVRIPQYLNSVGEGAFAFCTSLTKVSVPAGVGGILSNAFLRDTSLTDLYIYAEPTDMFVWDPTGTPTQTNIHVPEEYKEAYKAKYPGIASQLGTAVEEDISTWGQLSALLEKGVSVTLEHDITAEPGDVMLTVYAPNGGSDTSVEPIVLDLNGHTLNRGGYSSTYSNGSNSADGALLNYTNLIIRDSSSTQSGCIINAANTGVINEGILTLESGKIMNNTGTSGGGVYNDGTMYIKGGSISGNTAYSNGGGIYSYGELYITGGSITNNLCGGEGGGIFTYDTVYLEDSPYVLGNQKNVTSGSPANDVYFSSTPGGGYSSGIFNVTGAIGANARVGFKSYNSCTFTEQFANAGRSAADVFDANGDTFEVITQNGEAALSFKNFETWADLKRIMETAEIQPDSYSTGTLTIALTHNISAGAGDEDITLGLGRNIVLDLNGYTLATGGNKFIVRAPSTDGGYYSSTGASLAIQDSSGGSGLITTGDSTIFKLGTYASLSLQGGKIVGAQSGKPVVACDDDCTLQNSRLYFNDDIVVECPTGSAADLGGGEAFCGFYGGKIDCFGTSSDLSVSSAIVSSDTFAGKIHLSSGEINTQAGAGLYLKNAYLDESSPLSGELAITCTNVTIHSEEDYAVHGAGSYHVSVTQQSALTGGLGSIYLPDGMKISPRKTTYTGWENDAFAVKSVKMENPGVFTSGFNSEFSGYDPTSLFSSADDTLVVNLVSGEAMLGVGAQTWKEVQEKLSAGQNVVLGTSITAEEDDTDLEVPSGKTVSIDLNGFTLDRGIEETDGRSGRVINNRGNLTIKDSSSSKRGQIVRGYVTQSSEEGFTDYSVTYVKTVGANGGAIYNHAGATLTIKGGTFEDNYAKDSGGAIYIEGGQAQSKTTNSSGNYTYYSLQSTMTMTGGSISGNRAENNGGGIYNGYNCYINGGTVSYNKAGKEGGGVYNANRFKVGTNTSYTTGSFTITSGTHEGNEAGTNGGAVANYGRSSISGCELVNNKALEKGGAVFLADKSYVDTESFYDVTVKDNTAGEHGGGIYYNYGNDSNGSKYISKLRISGTVIVKDNELTDGTSENLYITSGYMSITGKLNDDTHIDLTYGTTVNTSTTVATDYSNYASAYDVAKLFNVENAPKHMAAYYDSVFSKIGMRKLYLVGTEALAGGDIGLRFTIYMQSYSASQTASNAEMRFTWGNENTQSYHADGTPNEVVKLTKRDDMEGNYYYADVHLSAKEMNDDITAVLHYGTSTTLDTRTISAADNLRAVESGSFTAAEKALARSLLIYGANARSYFKYNDETLTISELDPELHSTFEYTAAEPQEPTDAELESVGLTYYGSSLKLRHKTIYTLYFTKTEAADGIAAEVNGEAVEVKEYSKDKSMLYIDLEDIALEDLTENITITLTKGEKTAEMTCNAGTYIESMMNDSDASLAGAMKALYDCNRKAVAYKAANV